MPSLNGATDSSRAPLEARPHLSLIEAGDRELATPPTTDSLLADATIHLVQAYEAIDRFSQACVTSSRSPAFATACRHLCAALVAMDQFTQLIWGDP
jgi:hypothetical protein